MKTLLIKHPKNFFNFKKHKMYHKGFLKTTLTFAFWQI